ncbi:hypothetical protein B1P85_13830 [Enterococcus faecalis]|nr:hypothetical protein B1P85_13830 [Enterococcus faecalis]
MATCLLVQPFLSVSAWAIEGEQQTERTQTQPKTAETSTSEATKESSAHSTEQSSMTESSAITEKVTTSSTETKPSEEQKQITLTFETTDQALFQNDAKSYQVVKEKNQHFGQKNYQNGRIVRKIRLSLAGLTKEKHIQMKNFFN